MRWMLRSLPSILRFQRARSSQMKWVSVSDTSIYMLDSKEKKEMTALEVLAKGDAAVKWCEHATMHAATYGGKPWKYLLIPHDAIADNVTLDGLEDYLVISDA